MESNSYKYKISFGGWYQRTTLHLTEVYDFLANKYSRLELSKDKLEDFHAKLKIKQVSREVGYLEYVKSITKDNIEIRYYEDGLYVLQLYSNDIKKDQKTLEEYFNNYFSPAISYIFSLGAPTPKVLANIKTTHPIVVTLESIDANFQVDVGEFGPVYSKITSHDITVYKTPSYIIIVPLIAVKKPLIDELVEMQIFFREFKDQLEKYLNIHRKIWEEISEIKERKQIKASDVGLLRSKLDSYQKTISLINNRINQMGTYVHTRSAIAKDLDLEEKLVTLYQYKFEILLNTLDYIKEIWKMTENYILMAIQVITEIENQSINNSLIALRVVTTIGAIAGVFTYLSNKSSLPAITKSGITYLVILVGVTWLVNYLITIISKNLKYKIKFTETASKI